MASKSEQNVSRSLLAVLIELPDNAQIPNSEQFRDVLSGLEFFLPEILRERHAEWKYESLDGILPFVARKTGEREAEILGDCILITDQTLTPLHIRLQVSPCGSEISWLELKLGEKGHHGKIRTPYRNPSSTTKRLYRLSEGRTDEIEWVYKITFGDRV